MFQMLCDKTRPKLMSTQATGDNALLFPFFIIVSSLIIKGNLVNEFLVFVFISFGTQ